MTVPIFIPQHTSIQQHTRIQLELTFRHSRKFCFQLIHLTGRQKTAPSQVDAQDRFTVGQRKISLVQDRTVAANGKDHICLLKALFLRQVLYPHHPAVCLHGLLHKHRSAVV